MRGRVGFQAQDTMFGAETDCLRSGHAIQHCDAPVRARGLMAGVNHRRLPGGTAHHRSKHPGRGGKLGAALAIVVIHQGIGPGLNFGYTL